MAGNVRISTENMKLLRDAKKATGPSLEFLANKAVREMFGQANPRPDPYPYDGLKGVDPDLIKNTMATELEKVVKAKAPVKRFVKPELGQLQNYFAERGSLTCNDDADGFMDHYDGCGWKTGKNPMKDWKASVRNWLRGKKKEAERNQSFGKKSDSTRDTTLQQELTDRSWAK